MYRAGFLSNFHIIISVYLYLVGFNNSFHLPDQCLKTLSPTPVQFGNSLFSREFSNWLLQWRHLLAEYSQLYSYTAN
jgi:hypothetical protein